MRQSWHQFHSNHKHWGSWLTHSENVDKCVNSSIITCPQGQSRNCLQISPWELVSWVTHNCATFLPPSPLLILQGPLGSDLWTLTCFLQTIQHALVFLLISYFLPLTGGQYDIIISLIIMAFEYGMLKGHKTLPCETDAHHFQTPKLMVLLLLYSRENSSSDELSCPKSFRGNWSLSLSRTTPLYHAALPFKIFCFSSVVCVSLASTPCCQFPEESDFAMYLCRFPCIPQIPAHAEHSMVKLWWM